MMGKDSSVGGFIVGLVLGAAIGAAVGFLLAPVSGKEAREYLADKAEDVKETARDLTADRKKVYTETWKQKKEQAEAST